MGKRVSAAWINAVIESLKNEPDAWSLAFDVGYGPTAVLNESMSTVVGGLTGRASHIFAAKRVGEDKASHVFASRDAGKRISYLQRARLHKAAEKVFKHLTYKRLRSEGESDGNAA